MSVRRFRVLLRRLPASALVYVETNGGWSVTDHLLADVWEAILSLRGMVAATVTTKPGHRLNVGEPAKYPRPAAKRPKKSFSWGGLARSLLQGGE